MGLIEIEKKKKNKQKQNKKTNNSLNPSIDSERFTGE
jgi:hypothetical protein